MERIAECEIKLGGSDKSQKRTFEKRFQPQRKPDPFPHNRLSQNPSRKLFLKITAN